MERKCKYWLFVFLMIFLPLQGYEHFEKVFQEHKSQLKHLGENRKELFFLFSGPPGFGKTTLAKAIEEKFKGIRLNGDKVRTIMKNQDLDPYEIDHSLRLYHIDSYFLHLIYYLTLNSPNKCLIIDRSADRKYAETISWAKAFGYETIFIRLQTSKQKAIDRIKKRNINYLDYLRHMDKWYEDYMEVDLSCVDYIYESEKESIQEFVNRLMTDVGDIIP